ncbi:cationic amino acid transporter 2-like [Antedon mediterranea]|uniref:cationic amino acid transporter 2-like n=1 Tax=Antedon mediterranea TaxID=105859 RepID=UPI003AF66FD5
MTILNFFSPLFRKKHFAKQDVSKTELKRCLTTVDLTFLGIGSTLGAGAYILSGQVAKEKAGPAVVLSFLVAAVASLLAGLCYAEFGARVPRTGSAYVYSYVTVGEIWAFVIGWNLILEYVIGTSSVARAWSAYFDTLVGGKIEAFTLEHLKINVSWLADYPDFLAFSICILLSILLGIGVKESSRFNTIFTIVNLIVLTYVIICGMFKADTDNWKIPEDDVPPKYGDGGFFPYGFSGMISGAATCFYGFVGFDCIATTGEEAKNPRRAIPISIVISLFFIFIAYFGISMTITLMCPYFLLDEKAPLPFVFDYVGWTSAKYVISIGAVCALSTSLLGAMFPLPRVIYAMASDGIIFRFLARINSRTKTPVLATILSGVFAGLMALIFDLDELVNMMSIGTLLAYTLVAFSVVVLRYRASNDKDSDSVNGVDTHYSNGVGLSPSSISSTRLRIVHSDVPTQRSENISKICIGVTCTAIIAISVLIVFALDDIAKAKWWALLLLIITSTCLVAGGSILALLPQDSTELAFKVPLVPLLPLFSIWFNVILMLKLDYQTWIRFAVWMAIGFVVYFVYGIFNSNERKRYVDEDKDESDETAKLLDN